MTVAIGVVVAVVVIAALGASLAFAGRRRDEATRSSSGRTVLEDPAPPYQSAKGFRLLDGSAPAPRHAPAPLRLEPSHEYVFSDPTVGSDEVDVGPHRHDVQWALERSAHRSPLTRRRRRVVLALVIVAVLAAGVYLHFRHSWFGGQSNSGAPASTRAPIEASPTTVVRVPLTATRSTTGASVSANATLLIRVTSTVTLSRR